MNDVMKVESTLPADFDGVFKFTNWSDEEFIGVWGKKEYHFPANATSPMIIPEHSPLEIQQIRKKFAKDLAEREFFKGNHYETLRSPEGTLGNRTMSGIQTAGAYTMDDLATGIQMCLKPLEVKKAFVESVSETPMEEKLSRNEDGELNTKAVDKKASLRQRALDGGGLPTN
ncbi:MAG: hypothetical protein IPP74_14575 [Alphaproteobacteria bacterium]|nr:hypothetical protein [Alphaproteobacteria bacterium]